MVKNKAYFPIIQILVITTVVFIIHKLIFYIFKNQILYDLFYYSTEKLYLIFILLSIIIVVILIKVKKQNIDLVGNTFLLLTSIKMAVAYVLLTPILKLNTQAIKIEKINFFIIFVLFLAIETLVTIRLLNNKQ